MTQEDLEKTAFLFASKSLCDELERLQEKAETKLHLAKQNSDMYGALFYHARAKWLRELIVYINDKV